MPQLQVIKTSKRPQKICVVGSALHQGVTCVEWDDVSDVNLVDFDVVIVNVKTLPPHCWNDVFGRPMREALSNLIASQGFLMVLGGSENDFSRLGTYHGHKLFLVPNLFEHYL